MGCRVEAVDEHRYEQALQVLRASPDKPATAAAMLEYSMICLTSARYREAIDTFLRNHEFLLRSPDDPSEQRSAGELDESVGTSWSRCSSASSAIPLRHSMRAFGVSQGGESGRGTVPGPAALHAALSVNRLRRHARMRRLIASVDSTPIVILPFERRSSMVMCGLAEAGLGNAATARDYLSGAEHQIREQPVMLDWYMTLMLEWGRVNLLLLTGARAEAAARADRFIRLAAETDERTWQALAFETWARGPWGAAQPPRRWRL